jgi:fructoselysine-6-P-deglycase FrlB-like protein
MRMAAFRDRLAALPVTYRQACEQPLEDLLDEFRIAGGRPVIAIASGGSLVTARLLARLIEQQYGSLARAVTPLEFVTYPEFARGKHLWLISAEGSNPDILMALGVALDTEPARITVLCNRRGSPLANSAAAAGCATLVFSAPGQKDGFLATHTLLLSCTLLLRAAAAAVGDTDPTETPVTVEGLPLPAWMEARSNALRSVFARETVILAYDPLVAEASLLLETNIWEAALGNVQTTDLRNFAHGRHHWLAKRAGFTSILALTTSITSGVWAGVERFLPPDVPCAVIEFEAGSPAMPIAALWAAIAITGIAGEVSGIDPSKPGVPEFGRAIYNATSLSSVPRTPARLVPALRKQAARRAVGLPPLQLSEIRAKEAAFRERLGAVFLGGLVLDYDGTIVETRLRVEPPDANMATALVNLLGAGLPIGIATGRGGSVGEDLRTVIPSHLWKRVLIGYYNGASCVSLDEMFQGSAMAEHAGIASLVRELMRDDGLAVWIAEVKHQRVQASFAPRAGITLDALRLGVMDAAERLGIGFRPECGWN